MKILYGIQSTGNGHITRSSKIAQRLSKEGCRLDILLSGKNSKVNFPFPIKYNLNGLTFYYNGNGNIDYWESYKQLKMYQFFKDLKLNLSEYDLIITDFEPITAWAAKFQDKMSVGIANQYSFLSNKTPRPEREHLFSELIMRWMAPVKIPIGLHFKKYDNFIKYPILRDSLYKSLPTNSGHYTVYLSNWNLTNILQHLKRLDLKFEIFSDVKKPIRYHNCFIRPIDKNTFDESIRNSKGVITAAGFQTCAEALYLNKDLIVIPIQNQYEQRCNAESLKEIGVKVGKLESIETLINMGKTQITESWRDPTEEIVNEILNLRLK